MTHNEPIFDRTQYVDAAELAAELGIHRLTLYGWRRAGKGPPWIRLGGKYLYERARVREWLTAGGQ